MTKKEWLAVFGTALVLSAGYAIYGNQMQKSSGNQQAAATAEAANFLIGSIHATIVTYDGSGFSPTNVSIPKGGAVIFRNYSSKKLRVASNPHPSHEGYPTKDGCISSTFDSCSDIPPNVSWSFTFDMPGSWGYHNHLNPSQSGIITVQ